MAPKRSAPQAAAAAEPAAEEEVAFPRGGGHSLSALEAKQLRAEGAAQARAEAAAGGRRNKKARTEGEVDLDAEFGGSGTGFLGAAPPGAKLPKFVELLKFKGLTVGTRVWGVVTEATVRHLTISLPHGLRGTVSPPEASDVLSGMLKKAGYVAGAKTAWPAGVPQLPQLFYIGQLVRCIVVDVGGDKKKVGLSLNVGRLNGSGTDTLHLGAVLPAVVKGVEDHGYSLSFGIKGAAGFLKKADHEAAFGGGAGLRAGAVVEAAVTSVADRRMIGVTTAPAAVAAGTLRNNVVTEMGSLLPGALVNARVKAVLSDGLLVSFLTYFTGTIDPFHLGQDLAAYSPGQHLKARLLAVNPTTKAAALSLQPHLLNFTITPDLPPIGEVFESAVVKRVDASLGLVLDLSAAGGTAPSVPAFAHISALTDTHIDKIGKVFKVGQTATARVIGSRPLDGMAVVSLKPSVVQQTLMSYDELSAGQKVTGTIAAIDEKGAMLTLAPGIKARVALEHMSDTGGRKGAAKWAVGATATARVLDVDPAARRCRATLKKTLVASKLPPLLQLQDAVVGARAHGTVTGATALGVFVAFYKGLSGLVHERALGLAPDQTPEDAFKIGQVLKVTILSVDHKRKRLSLGLAAGGAAASAEPAAAEAQPAPDATAPDSLQPCTIVEFGTVTGLQGSQEGGAGQYVEVDLPGGGKGQLAAGHLSDHPAAAQALWEVMSSGITLGPLLVLERLQKIGVVKLSRKSSLLSAAAGGALPSAIADVRESALLQGYVASLTPDAAFIRFGGTLTGRAGLAQLGDSFVSDPRRQFAVGQSVRAQVVQVDGDRARFSVTLKPALVASPHAALLASLFADLELAASLRNEMSAEDAAIPWEAFPVGSVAGGSIGAREEYGLTIDLAADRNVVGLVSKSQEPEKVLPEGSAVVARVLDVSKADGVVDLSLKPHLLPPPRKSGKPAKPTTQPKADKWKVTSDKVVATVQLVKPEYLVASLPARKAGAAPTLGFLATRDFNLLAAAEAGRRFQAGQTLVVTVSQLPSAETGGRLLLHTAPQSEAAAAAAAAAAEKKAHKSKAQPGETLTGIVMHSSPISAEIKLESGERARLHITEWLDAKEAAKLTDAGAFAAAYPEGGPFSGVVVGTQPTPAGKRHHVLEVTARPSAVVAAAGAAHPDNPQAVDLASLQPGQTVQGFVQEVGKGHVFVALSPTVRGRLHATDCAGPPARLADLASAFTPGQPLRCRVLQVNRATRQVDLSEQALDSGGKPTSAPPAAGTLATGCVVRTGSDGVVVHLAEGRRGRACLADIHDTYVDKALAGIQAGTMVRAMVLGESAVPASAGGGGGGGAMLHLSLKASMGGAVAGRPGDDVADPIISPAALASASAAPALPAVGDQVHGYITGMNPKAGAFVVLRSRHVAHIKKSQLAEGYVQDLPSEFPVGKHVRGHITSVDGTRVEMSLRSPKKGGSAASAVAAAASVAEIPVGAVLPGFVRRVEAFGVFVEVGGKGGPSGLAHISEVSDGFVGNIHSAFKAGQEVRVKVLKVDVAAGKLSLSLKPSVTEEADGGEDDDDNEAGSEASEDLDEAMAERHEALQGADDDDDEVEAMESLDDSDDEGQALPMDSDEEGSEDVEADLEGEMEGMTAGGTEEAEPGTPAAPLRTLDLGADGAWGAAEPATAAADAEIPAAEEADGKKLSKMQKKRAKAEKEAAIRKAELARANPDSEPDSVEAFEALVAGQPHSSHAWIRYMAFLLGTQDAAGARAVAERALETISFREEDEKFNVWRALMNLENSFGSPPEAAAMACFQRAAQHTEPKRLHLAAADMFASSGRTEAARTVLKAACRKFSQSAKVWLRAISVELGEGGGGSAAAQKVLDRALAALPPRKHIKVVTQAALAEFRSGSVERGRSIMEGILRNYPKRLDLWSVYLDQEVKVGDAARTRALFERCITLQLPAKKMKFFFKRYLQYETDHGTDETRQHVQDKAREFVSAL